MDKVRGKTRKRHPLKDAMNESKLFPGTHPATVGSKYAKAVELPDPDLEPLEPEDCDEKPPPSETAKSVDWGPFLDTPGATRAQSLALHKVHNTAGLGNTHDHAIAIANYTSSNVKLDPDHLKKVHSYHSKKDSVTSQRLAWAANRLHQRHFGTPIRHESDTAKAISMLQTMMKAEPDTTGKLEGKFKVSCEKMISQLNKIISAEYSQWMRWYHYGLVLRGHCRDALADHFYEHAEEELKHAETVAMRVVGLGGYPATSMEHPEPLRETEEILKELLRREQEGMQLYREVHALCGDNEGTRQVLEGNMGQEQEHIDDLWRYLKHPELIKANFSSGEDTMKPEKRKIAEYEHSFARRPDGITGAPTPDLPERGFDWHDEHGGPKPPAATPEDEEEQEEAEEYFKPPANLLKPPKGKLPTPQPTPQTQEAQKALAGAPRFANGPVMAPRAVDFLMEHGFTPDEIEAGEANMTPRMRGLYNRNLLSQVRKSISGIGRRK